MEFKNKIIAITGGASGIGEASARLFSEKGAKIVVSDIDLSSAQNVADSLPSEAISVQTDVADYNQVEALIRLTVDRFGAIDVLVNNAGIGPQQMLRTADHTLSDWDRVIAVNQSGVFYGMKCALKRMIEQGHGNIVNVASLAGLKASGSNISYSASKFAVVGMTKSAALEYARKNIRINAVCPSYTETNLLDQLFSVKEGMEEKLKSLIPMNRFGSTKDIAEAIVWLASTQTSFITGQTITLDGGASL